MLGKLLALLVLGASCVFPATLAAQSPIENANNSLQLGRAQESSCDEACVDSYYLAAVTAWQCGSSGPDRPAMLPETDAWQVYHTALKRLLLAGQRFKRLDSHSVLRIYSAQGPTDVPVSHHGFIWNSDDFDYLLTFRFRVLRRLPTSVDMMSPSSPLIPILNRLPVSRDVCIHTIYSRRYNAHCQPNDDLVAVSSARRTRFNSELEIGSKHIDMPKDPKAIAEIKRILCQHAACSASTDIQSELTSVSD